MTVAVRTDLTAVAVRAAAKGGGDAGPGASAAGDRAGLGGSEPRGRRPQHRHGPADLARLGASLQRRRPGWAGRAQGAGAAAPAERRAARRAARLPGERPRSRAGRRGALAAGRSVRSGRAAFRRPLPGAGHGQARRGARLHPDLGAAAAPQVRLPKRKPSSKKLPDLIAAAVGEKARGKRLEIWFQDESRIGQKGGLTRQWAPRGSRPRQPRDQRYAAAYIFAAVCPAAEKTAALVLPARRHRGHEPASGRDRASGRRPRPMLWSSSTRPAGTAPGPCGCPKTSRCCRSRPTARS